MLGAQNKIKLFKKKYLLTTFVEHFMITLIINDIKLFIDNDAVFTKLKLNYVYLIISYTRFIFDASATQ